MLLDLEWSAIIDGIGSQECVICLGPEIFMDYNNTNSGVPVHLTEKLSEYLKQYEDILKIRIQENGWFHLQQGGSDGPTYQAIKSFYNNVLTSHTELILNKIARIKSHLFLSITPDYHLLNTFENLGLKYNFDSYFRNQPNRNQDIPSVDIPLIYNLLGELKYRNSLVLTYDDFFDYLESVIKGNSMSKLIKNNLLDAQYYLFIGIPFDQWFVHLFMRILKQHKQKKTKFAAGKATSFKNR
ncbi:MAG: SIR2 family protein, partial [Bacteroidota bacterium]